MRFFFFFRKADNPFEFYSDIARKTSKKLPPPPYNLTIFKGHKDVALTRSSAEFFMTSKLGKGFLKWLNSGVGFPEEFFFATLSRVSQHLYNTEGLISQSEFCFYLLAILWNLTIQELYNPFFVNNVSMPVGISEKGLVIACGGDWYLYLSLCTQPNIE